MDVYVDGRKTNTDHAVSATVDDVLEAVRIENSSEGVVIVGFACDGIDVEGDQVADVLAAVADDYARIDVETGQPRVVVGDALVEARLALNAADEQRREATGLFAQGKTTEAMKILSQCVSQWLKVNDVVVQAVSFLGQHEAGIAARRDEFSERMAPVRGKLTEVKDAILAQDFVTLADILEYEFDFVCDIWRGLIDDMRVPKTESVKMN